MTDGQEEQKDVPLPKLETPKGPREIPVGTTIEALAAEKMKAETALLEEKTAFYQTLNKSIPIVVEKAEEFFKIKSEDLVKSIQDKVTGNLDFMIVRVLFDAGLVEKEALDKVAFRAQTMYNQGQQPQPVDDAASAAMGNFIKPPMM